MITEQEIKDAEAQLRERVEGAAELYHTMEDGWGHRIGAGVHSNNLDAYGAFREAVGAWRNGAVFGSSEREATLRTLIDAAMDGGGG